MHFKQRFKTVFQASGLKSLPATHPYAWTMGLVEAEGSPKPAAGNHTKLWFSIVPTEDGRRLLNLVSSASRTRDMHDR